MANFKKHDEVCLLLHGVVVGIVTLQKFSPSEVIRGSALGEGKVGVMIDEVFDDNVILPCPS